MVEGVRAGGIGGPGPLTRDAGRAAEGHFTVEDAVAPLSQNARLSSASPIGLESMLALQGVSESVERDRVARKHGTATIAALSKLQRAMLAGQDPSQLLSALNELTANMPIAGDPGLGAILRAVALRARVEIARRERASK
jgi:hypothetical protein